MPIFNVEISRTAVRHATLSIEAESTEAAEQAALDRAGDTLFGNEKTAEYEIQSITLKQG